jgi:glycosyltransferase involved in cell wall biosynthesis
MKIAYILSKFPKLSEAFVLREIIELQKNNFEIEIFSLKNIKKNELMHDDAKKLLDNTNYSPYLFSKGLISANLYFLFKSSLKYLKLILYIIKHNYKSINFLIKSLIIFPKSIYFAKIIKDKKIEHVHAHWATFPTLTALITNKLADIPFSFTAHAHDIYFSNFDNKLANSAKKIITISNYNKKYLSKRFGIPKKNIEVVYSGVDLNRFRPVTKMKPKKFTILNVGRLDLIKGQKYLIEACKILKNKKQDFTCRIIGDGKEKKNLLRLINNLKLNDQVKLLGPKKNDELIKYHNLADVLVISSDSEGLPVVAVEAMACKLPVIATNIRGVPEIIKNNFNGFLVPARNPQQIADKILELKNDEKLQSRLKDNSRMIIEENFNIKRNIKKLIKLFEND